jgi:colanic acid/amylovoran biosynthesis glycosyltransferase
MRLCILAETYPSTTQTFVYESVEWLRRAGHEVTVVAERRGDPPGAEAARFPARLVPPWLGWSEKLARLAIDPVRAAGALNNARRWAGKSGWTVSEIAARALLEPIRKAEFVLAHFGPLGSRWLPVVAVARRPFAVFFHGYDATADLRKRPTLYAGLVRAGVAGITNSEYIRQCLVSAGYPGGRIGVVPMGVSSELVEQAERPTLASRRILTIARLVPKKGLADSLRAFAAALPILGNDWRYQVVGDGPMLAELQALAGSLGLTDRVEFSGFLSRADTLAALRNASVFVLASRTAASGDTEGTPISILEAASIGLPVVSTLHAGIPEILPSEGAAEGWLVPEGDVGRLTAALERLATQEVRRDWGDRCRARVRTRHSPTAHIEGTIAALERLARIPTAPHPRPAARVAG